ncbi:hypothetical protein CcI49_16445 [Frankia sp. CcI49]|uniref:hypothetical protein n=1 Tax=unclassified Frankia TaxID=2632575 RepID=UPI0006CA53E2|nr:MULTISPECIES: hypothetical protein [unclassified Frankia]KPM51210.1 hypothetical protein ACG83_34200 [Frankia sp. R43]ONH59560.1 hypothetical protein CcI49_16445 [Frankia sp. CcI49]
MANFTSKVQELLHSPKAQEMVDKAKTVANKPENRAKFKQLTSKFTGKGRGPGGGGSAGQGHTSSMSSTPSTGPSGPIGGAGRGSGDNPSDYGPF